jgi:hypothetical protein
VILNTKIAGIVSLGQVGLGLNKDYIAEYLGIDVKNLEDREVAPPSVAQFEKGSLTSTGDIKKKF